MPRTEQGFLMRLSEFRYRRDARKIIDAWWGGTELPEAAATRGYKLGPVEKFGEKVVKTAIPLSKGGRIRTILIHLADPDDLYAFTFSSAHTGWLFGDYDPVQADHE